MEHAGFAAAIVIGQTTMQDLVRALYVANRIPHRVSINTTFAAGGFSSVRITGALFFDVPVMTLSAASGDRYQLGLRAWGTVRVRAGGATMRPTVLVQAQASVPPSLAFSGSRLAFGLDATNAVVQSVTLTVIGGGAATAAAVQQLTASPGFQTAFLGFVQAQLARIRAARLDLAFLGGILDLPTKSATARVLDGALAIGIDASTQGPIVEGLVTVDVGPTQGDPAALADFRQGADIAYWIHPNKIPEAFTEVASTIDEKARAERARVLGFQIAAREGVLHIDARAQNDRGIADIHFDLVPVVTSAIAPEFERVEFHTRNVDVGVSSTGAQIAEGVGGAFTFGIVALFIDGLVRAFAVHLERSIENSGNSRPRNRRFRLPGTAGPDLDLYVLSLASHERGFTSQLRLRPRIAATRVRGVSRVFATPAGVRAQVLYAVTLTPTLLRSDPQLRISWTLRRLDTNRAVHAVDDLAAVARTYRADLVLADADAPPPLALTCRVYRTMGAAAEDLYTSTVRLRNDDRLDRRHPYVRWRSHVRLPAFIREDDVFVPNPLPFIDRVSTIHRTDLPGRCLFADQYSSFAEPVYMDALPVAHERVVAERNEFCDYCFFGGPDKDTPLR